MHWVEWSSTKTYEYSQTKEQISKVSPSRDADSVFSINIMTENIDNIAEMNFKAIK